ncbi:hypothetical protein C8Q69DRAFT_406742 [Paecilomyces variotii]|uniref:F-box domain-containing protein n=1 Tax=Byssochlamys spectabilis TaxID=264951 RepID=A0A443HM75_BYSSP|nr:hypothetical protein C8Q69DRAFT_406742 [Paecilomyces variotii]KAJ9364704.1 hypothetical protein DTO280E4_1484 [Paecilomyces variotii]KAJ9392870.1 hypothetical protein DTO063F5_7 [Paecilomyces variotii]RWQ92880.1 hypothetical protein C8Q69DRAFT_406742 [Paecilomyces variotii]
MDPGQSRLAFRTAPRRILQRLISLTETTRKRSNAKRSPARKNRGEGSERCLLLELPTELLFHIVSYLDHLSEATLALTCRRLFAISGSALRSETLRFDKDFAPLFHHYKNEQSFATQRWKLMKLLEDKKWRLCSKCLKLHPSDAFPSKELKRCAEVRTCNLGELAGIVDLCPCKKLTFRDKLDLVDQLKAREEVLQVMSLSWTHRPPERYCWHSCVSRYGKTELKIEIYPELDEAGRLLVRTEYHLSTEPTALGKEQHMTPRFGCAHRSMDLWLSSVCQTLYCHLYDSFCTSCKRMSACSSCDTVLKCPKKRPYYHAETKQATYFFWTQRCLGKTTTHPDRSWAAQRIHPADSFITWDNCRELCPWTIREHPPLSRPPSLGLDILDPALDDHVLRQLYSSIHMV